MGKVPPGTIVLLDTHKTTSKKKGQARVTHKNSMSADFRVETDLAYDLDARKVVEHISIALATHYQNSLLVGQRADGSGPLPGLSDRTVATAIEQGTARVGGFGLKSGWMARNWTLGKIRGTSLRATRQVKPNGGNGRNFMINQWLDRPNPVDLQSTIGAAAFVIQRGLAGYVEGAHGQVLYTPKTARIQAGTLPQLKR